MADPRKVGTQLVVEGQTEYNEAMRVAEANTKAVALGIQGFVASIAQLSGGVQVGVASLAQFNELMAKAAQGDIEALTKLKEFEAGLRDIYEELFQAHQEAAKGMGQEESAAERLRGRIESLQKQEGAYFDAVQRSIETGTQVQRGLKSSDEAYQRYINTLKTAQETEVAFAQAEQESSTATTQRALQIVQSGVAFGATGREMADALQAVGLSARQANEFLQQYGITVERTAGAQGRMGASNMEVSRGFFALTLAGFGLMEVQKQLEEAYGRKLPEAFDKSLSALKEIASFGSAGAFIGGLPGGVIGAIAGILISLPAILDQSDPRLKELLKTLDSIGSKDDALDVLSKLIGLDREGAQAALDAAKGNTQLLEALEARARIEMELQNLANIQPGQFGSGAGKSFPEAQAQREALEIQKAQNDAVIQAILIINEQQSAIEKRNKTIDSFIEKLQTEDDLIESAIGLTKDQTDEVVQYTEKHKDAGDALANTLAQLRDLKEAQAQDTEHAHLYTAAITELEKKANDQATALYNAAEAEKKHGDEAEKAARALHTYANAIDDANFRLQQLTQRTQNQQDEAQQQYANSVQDAAEARANAIQNAEQNLTDRIADLWTNLQDRVVDINVNLGDRIADINTQLANRIADIEASLQDKLVQIQQDLSNRRAALAHDYQQQIQHINEQTVDAARDLAQKLYEIERTRIESIARLDFDVAEQLRGAQTEHEVDSIRRRELFERSQLDQRANDDRTDAERAFQTKLDGFAKERVAAKDNYDYEVRLANQLAAQKTAAAERDASRQIAIAERNASQQVAIAQREAQEAVAIAQRRYEEELAQAQRTYSEQVAAAQKAEVAKTNDAQRALEQRLKAIVQAADLEIVQIERVKQKALESYLYQISLIQDAVTKLAALINAYQSVVNPLDTFFDFPNLAGGFQNLVPENPPGGASGLEMDVPQGYPNDSYYVRASSGEHVSITPAAAYNQQGSTDMTINIYDATDPVRVGEQVRRVLQEATAGAL